MPIQLNIWLLLLGGVQGLLLSVVLIKKKTYRLGYGFLLAYLLVMVAQILFKVLDKRWLIDGSGGLYFLSYKFPLLYGPLIWLFTRQLIQRRKMILADLLHFLPFVYSVVILNLGDSVDPLGLLYWPMEALPAFLLQVISLVYYHLLAFRIWRQHRQQVQPTHSELLLFQTKWIKSFLIGSLIVCSTLSLLSYLIYLWYPAHNWLRFGFLLLCVFIYCISYSAIHQSRLFSSIENEPPAEKPFAQLPALVVHRPQKKYANSNLTDEEAARILLALKTCMEKDRLYTDPQLSIDSLVDRLHTNRYLLSQVLNQRLGQSFYKYVNSLRVEAAKEMLVDAKFEHHKIASLGYEAGFNSLSTFNEVFKKLAGVTPSEYKKLSAQQLQQKRV